LISAGIEIILTKISITKNHGKRR